jgi:hypothetical protein
LTLLAGPASAEQPAQVRAVDPWALESLDRARSRSPLARALISELEGSDVIVHIATTPRMHDSLAGMTRFASNSGGYRYLRIDINRSLLPDERAAILGHELQHACEIARSGAASQESVRQLFATIGTLVLGGDTYETQEAARTTIRVWRELRSRSAGEPEHPPAVVTGDTAVVTGEKHD